MNAQPDHFRDRVIAAAEAASKAGSSVGPPEFFQEIEARALVRERIDRVVAGWSRP